MTVPEALLLAACVALPWMHAIALYRRSRQLRDDSKDAGEASMQAAFWRSRALRLGASPEEYSRAFADGALEGDASDERQTG